MGALSAKLRNYADHQRGVHGIIHWCPGCNRAHAIATVSQGGPQWQWDGNVDAPTVSPSIRCFRPAQVVDGVSIPEETLCHYFLRAGNLEFCPDSPHALAGRTVLLPDWPSGYGD